MKPFLYAVAALALAIGGIAGLTALNPGSPPRTSLERIADEGFPDDLGPTPGTGVYVARWGQQLEVPPAGPLPDAVIDDAREAVVTASAGVERAVAASARVRALSAAGRPALVIYEDDGERGAWWIAAPARLIGQPPHAAYALRAETREDARTLADVVVDAVEDSEAWVVIDTTE